MQVLRDEVLLCPQSASADSRLRDAGARESTWKDQGEARRVAKPEEPRKEGGRRRKETSRSSQEERERGKESCGTRVGVILDLIVLFIPGHSFFP